ncbi:MAG: pyridoxamine 5'-phosphate oxidase family protein [Firmicutes bacterium]|nr:pyridoxamine 5'-phosphate oxidase family protein [Bacillota bacterium]
MEEILKYLREGAIGSFATVNDGKPDVRPWQFQFFRDGKFYFATANNKEVYRQLQKNPYAAFTTTTENFTTVRLYGRVVFTDDIKIKERILEKQEGIRNIYKSAGNPVFEAFYIEHGEAVISDFSGNPPRKITF